MPKQLVPFDQIQDIATLLGAFRQKDLAEGMGLSQKQVKNFYARKNIPAHYDVRLVNYLESVGCPVGHADLARFRHEAANDSGDTQQRSTTAA